MPDFHSLKDSYRRYALYEKGHRSKTVKQTISVLSRLHEFSGMQNIMALDTKSIRNFLQTQRQEKKWSAKTFRIYRQCLKTFFNWTIDEGYREENPVDEIKQPPLPKRLPRCLTKEQVNFHLENIREYEWYLELQRSRNEAIYTIIVYCGLRLSETQNLGKEAVNLSVGEIFVKAGKNEKDRTVPIPEELEPILENYIKEQKRLGVSSKWFFPSVKSEKRLTKKNMNAVFKKVSEISGIKVTAHMLRHTFGRLSVEADIQTRVIQTVMGHSDIRTTQIYTFVSNQTAKDAMRNLSLN